MSNRTEKLTVYLTPETLRRLDILRGSERQWTRSTAAALLIEAALYDKDERTPHDDEVLDGDRPAGTESPAWSHQAAMVELDNKLRRMTTEERLADAERRLADLERRAAAAA